MRRGTKGIGFVLFLIIVYLAVAYIGILPWPF